MDVLLESGLVMDPAVLAVLTESAPGGKKRRKVVIPQPRRGELEGCLLYTSPSPRDGLLSRMPSSA